MQEQLIYDIENVEVGDIAYFEGIEKGAEVVKVDPNDSDSRLKVETPEEFKPFNLAGASVWLKNSYFRRATRQILNKQVETSLPAVSEGHAREFETQEGVRVRYDGSKFHPWRVISSIGSERFTRMLDTAQFPLIDITEEEES